MGSKPRTKLVKKDFLQIETASVLPVEDFYPGCVCSMGQLLPGQVDVEKIKSAAALGMFTHTIAAMVGLSEAALNTHFPKTIAAARAHTTMDMLGLMHEKAWGADGAKDKDFQAIRELLDRQDPKPDKKLAITVQPLPQEIFHLHADELTRQLQLEDKKE